MGVQRRGGRTIALREQGLRCRKGRGGAEGRFALVMTVEIRGGHAAVRAIPSFGIRAWPKRRK